MSYNSEYARAYSKKFKELLVRAGGGRCIICGYNKCNRALSFHHMNDDKEFGIASIRSIPKNWDLILSEVKKCVLVCSNCHSEIHDNLIQQIPNQVWIEEFLDLKSLDLLDLKSNCRNCNKEISARKKFCSATCGSKKSWSINWSSIDLNQELKSKSILQLSKELGCSDAAIHKRIKKFNQLS